MIAEMADRVCANIQNKADKKEPAIPTAARDSTGFICTLPTMAVSVIDNSGSAIPEIIAGTANLLICLKVSLGFKNLLSVKREVRKKAYDCEKKKPPFVMRNVVRFLLNNSKFFLYNSNFPSIGSANFVSQM